MNQPQFDFAFQIQLLKLLYRPQHYYVFHLDYRADTVRQVSLLFIAGDIDHSDISTDIVVKAYVCSKSHKLGFPWGELKLKLYNPARMAPQFCVLPDTSDENVIGIFAIPHCMKTVRLGLHVH